MIGRSAGRGALTHYGRRLHRVWHWLGVRV